MSPEGIWTNEMMGLFGWESTGVLILERGRAIDGGNHHYSFGSHETTDDQIRISLDWIRMKCSPIRLSSRPPGMW